METYKKATKRLLTELAALHWDTRPLLKRPTAESPDTQYKIEFHPQSIYQVYETGRKLSMHVDMRGMSVYELLKRLQ